MRNMRTLSENNFNVTFFIIMELSIEDLASSKEMMRMSYADFLVILGHIEQDITPRQILGGNQVIL